MKDNNNIILNKEDVKFLVIHCSDTSDKKSLTAIDIHKMHLGFKWDGIGYHKIIQRNGFIENGRPEYWIGAHTKGLNLSSLGVCLIGRVDFTNEQFSSLDTLLRKWQIEYPNAKIIGHKNAIKTKKTCPNFDVGTWCKERGFNA